MAAPVARVPAAEVSELDEAREQCKIVANREIAINALLYNKGKAGMTFAKKVKSFVEKRKKFDTIKKLIKELNDQKASSAQFR